MDDNRGTKILQEYFAKSGKSITELVKGGSVIVNSEVKPIDVARDIDKRVKATDAVTEAVMDTPPSLPKEVAKKVMERCITITEDDGIYRATDYGLLTDRDNLFGEGETAVRALKELFKVKERADKLRSKLSK